MNEEDQVKVTQVGIIIKAGAEVPFKVLGKADSVKGHTYELRHFPNGEMALLSGLSGKQFVIPWDELIRLAIDAGVDEPDIIVPESRIVLQ